MISAWVVCGPSMTQEYNRRFDAENADPPSDYNGPMDDRSYDMMSSMADLTRVQPFYSTKEVQGVQPFTLFSMNFPDRQTTEDDLSYLQAQWPGNQLEIQGAWDWETGLPMGQEYNGEGQIIGEPVYVLDPTCYRLMPPSLGATSNLDLKDINRRLSQNARLFNPSDVAVLRAQGDTIDPAQIAIIGNWGPGRRTIIRFTVDNGGNEIHDIEYSPSGFISNEQVAQELAEAISQPLLFEATAAGTIVSVLPEAPTNTFTVTVLQ